MANCWEICPSNLDKEYTPINCGHIDYIAVCKVGNTRLDTVTTTVSTLLSTCMTITLKGYCRMSWKSVALHLYLPPP